MPRHTTDLTAAAAALTAGHLVAFPTETVYGLGADAANPTAIAALYRAKNRPPSHPVIIHLASFAAAADWASHIPPAAQTLAARHMPGPLTLLLPRHPAHRHLAGGDHIALRVPAHPIARQLLQKFGDGIAAPSANRHGAISPTSAAHVAAEFSIEENDTDPARQDIANMLIIDGGNCTVGIESTIIGFSPSNPNSAYIARPGHITAADLTAAGITLTAPPTNLAAPGRLPRHYAPRTPLQLTAAEHIQQTIDQHSPSRIAVLSRQQPQNTAAWRQAAPDPATYAQTLYRHLRELDATAAQHILIETPPQTEQWRAINDRLTRAATAK